MQQRGIHDRARIWSGLIEREASAINPNRETPPYVGLTPTVPVTDAYWRIEPPVSVPLPTARLKCGDCRR